MRIAGGSVFSQGEFSCCDVVIQGERVEALVQGAHTDESDEYEADGDEVFDATGCFVVPGLIDLHFHGCVGADLCDGTAEALHAIAEYEASRGVTSICPATMTFPTEVLEPVMRTVAEFEPAPHEATLLGINMEGPYISPSKVGAQNPAYVRGASVEEFDHLQELSNNKIMLVDVAPEEEGNLSFIEEVGERVRVSVAHTCCDYDCAAAAFEAGARQLTHLYNAMPGLHHRDPGPIAAAAERDDVMAEIIADGIHIHPSMVRLAFKLFGDDRMILISDTMRAAGLEDGVYDLGGQDVKVEGPRATLVRDGAIAGSVSDLLTCLQTAVRTMDIPLPSAVKAATENPACALGIEESCGSIAPGRIADIVVLDEDLNLAKVFLRGVAL